MATKTKINFGTILKRSTCLNYSVHESTVPDSDRLFSNIKSMLEKCKTARETNLQSAIRMHLESLSNTVNADDNYWQPLYYIEQINTKDTMVADRIVYEFTNRVLPYVQNISQVMDTVNRNSYSLLEDQKNSIIETCNVLNTADRIIGNHKMITKRFNPDRELNRFKNTGMKYFIDSCAMMIDTYNVRSYQKLNITIEEAYYLLEMGGYDYNKQELVKCALEYYLVQNPYVTNKDISDFRNCIKESYLLEEEDCCKVKYLFNDNRENYTSIEKAVQSFLLSSNKSAINLMSIINKTLENTSKEDIVYNINKFVYLLWDLRKAETFETDNGIYDCLKSIGEFIKSSTHLNDEKTNICFSKENVSSIVDTLYGIRKEVENLGGMDNSFAEPSVDFIKIGLDPLISELEYVRDLLYNGSNIKNIRFVNSNGNDSTMSLNEFKLFKFHNLVNAAFGLDRYLKIKEKKLYNKISSKTKKLVKKAKHILFGESTLTNYIGADDNKVDICVAQYSFDESNIADIEDFLSSVCNEYNDVLLSQGNVETARVYYTLLSEVAEIHIKDATTIELTESELEEVLSNNIDESFDIYFKSLDEINSLEDSIKELSDFSIEDSISNLDNFSKINMEKFNLALEAMSYLDIDHDLVKEFGQKFSDMEVEKSINSGTLNESYSLLARQEKQVNKLTTEWKTEKDVPLEIRLEAYNYLAAIFESMADDWEDDEEEEDTTSKEEKKPEEKKDDKSDEKKEEDSNSVKDPYDKHGIQDDPDYKPSRDRGKVSLNGIRLGLEGIKKKFKDMSQKEKEVSKNLDNSVRSLVKGMKDSMVSDRREAIIKGSIIPSFSRCIKNAIAIAGVSAVAGKVAKNPATGLIVATITALGGIALSKRLTKKERLLLLDEIETELEVVEKELQYADSNNQINKYRALLTYKKNLQRQYQRIRYNIRVGKDILPGTASGMRISD